MLWGVLLVRPIGHPPRPLPLRAADQRSRAYLTSLRVLRWGRYGQRGGGGGQTPEAGPLACVPCGHLSSRPPPPAVLASALPLPALVSPPSRASFSAQGLLPCPACPSFSPSALPRTGTMPAVAGPGSGWGRAHLRLARPACCRSRSLARAVFARVSPPPPLRRRVLHFCPLAALTPVSAAPAAASWRRVCSPFFGGGGAGGRGGMGGAFV